MSTDAAQGPWTVLRLINWTRKYFERHDVDQPRLAAELLLAHVAGCRRLDLYTRFEQLPPPEQLAAFRELVKRAARRQPVAYLIGKREFYSLSITVTPDVLIPRPETELLVDHAVEHLRPLGPAGRYWDACTGSGCVAVAVARNAPPETVLATDISAAAMALAAKNAEAHGLTGRVKLAEASLLDLPGELGGLGPFDAITVNPPYVSDAQMDDLPPEVRFEPMDALRAGADGLDFIRPILRQAPDRLNPGGLLAMEIGFGQAEAVWDLLNEAEGYENVQIVRDQAGIERVVLARRRKDR